MAAPVISTVLDPITLAPGGTIDVTIEAHDPDSANGSVSFPVTDGQGNTSTATVQLTLDDPIVFGDAVVSGVSVTVQRIATTATSATYRISA